MSHPTEGVPASKLNMPFARSFIESVDEESVEGRTGSGLKVSVSENSYSLFLKVVRMMNLFPKLFIKSKTLILKEKINWLILKIL